MINRWLWPILVGVFFAVAAWQVTMAIIPRTLMTLAISRVAQGGSLNRMVHGPLVTAKSRAIVRPSPDLLYSSCPFDVSRGPVLIDVAPIEAPYWSLAIFDSETNVAFVRNNLQTGGKPIHAAIALAGQAIPAGYQPVRVAGNRGAALVRVLVNRLAPIDEIDAERRQSSCRVAR